jgi:hypothetical protein
VLDYELGLLYVYSPHDVVLDYELGLLYVYSRHDVVLDYELGLLYLYLHGQQHYPIPYRML